MDIINDKSNDKGQSSNSGITNSQYQLPQTPQAQYCSPGYMYPQNMSMAASPYPVWGSLTPGVTNSGQATPNSPGSVNNDLVTMIIKRLDSMDSKLARLDSIQSSVNTINTRIQSMDTKINDLESKVRDIERIPVRDVLSVTSDATYIVGPSLNDSREQLFDVTRDGPVDTTVIHERSIGEPMLSCNVVDEAEVEYEVVEEGSNRKRQKLVSSDGFSYCVKDIAGEYSICIIEKLRNKERPIPVGSGDAASDEKTCLAMRRLISGVRFYQRGEVFSRGAKEHCHPADPLIKKRVLLTRDVRQEALRDVHAPAGSIVEGNMVGVFKDGEFNIPRPSNLLRRVNRSRQKVRPKDPTSLDFEVDTDYLQESFFIGDVRVGDERHLMFSTPSQLQFLGQARRWYLDGTFRVVNRPFTQLWSVHAFLQQGESVKQVPLLYVLMSKRRKQDYVAVLQKLIEIMEEAPKVEGFVMDFEA
ncbi:hypothetical protein MAR_005918, partial [Mya arenaria]